MFRSDGAGRTDGGTDGSDGAGSAASTAQVTRRDLEEREELDGTLGYGDTSDVVLTAAGTITALPELGTVVDRGQTLVEVEVSRPSDALAAKAEVDETLTALLLGLGSVALLVGGVGIANVMVISVLERRAEIGVRRAIGATRRHIVAQFLVESMLLAGLGGAVGVVLGAAITWGYADARGWRFAIPAVGLVVGVLVSLAVGALAGLYPAVRASRLALAEAVRSE